jgi:glycosyltransferase involved in cell wall biosynthesis
LEKETQMNPILSILTPTIPERRKKFNKLFTKLAIQIYDLQKNHPTLGEVELSYDDSEKYLNGGLSIGKKRESLLQRATGKYVCYLDDDEDIAPNYVETLVRLCHQDKDVVTFRNLTKTAYYWTIIDMSLNHRTDEEANPNYIIRRKPWHINPIRSVLAKMHSFEDTNYGEDAAWMNKVLKHCLTEAHTDMVLHCYNHSSSKSESDKIIKAGYQ